MTGEEREDMFDPSEIVLTVEEAALRLKIGRTRMYKLVSDGAVESVLIGRLRRIPMTALRRYVEKLLAEQNNDIAA